jgi:hypothetical protein
MKYSIQKLDLEHLSDPLKSEFRLFLPPRFRICLDGKDPDQVEGTKVLAFAASIKGSPIALAVAGLYPDVDLAELYAFKVRDLHAHMALGNDLLMALEAETFKNNALTINHYFRQSDTDTPAFRALLHERGWSKPQLYMLRYFFDCFTSNPPFYQYAMNLPEGYEVFPWSAITETDRKILLKESEQGRFSKQVSPFIDEEHIEPLNSLGLRYKGEVIGWVITHKIAPDTLKYTSLFVKPEYRFSGVSMKLMIDSMKIQQKSSIKWTIIEVGMEDLDRSWFKIVTKRLAPFALQVDEIYQTWKASSPEVFKFQPKTR